MSQTLRIHFMVPDPEGIIHSGRGGSNPLLQIGAPGRWRAACDPAVTMGPLDRGTGEPWACRCAACAETEIFKEKWRPKPGLEDQSVGQVATEDMGVKYRR
jgi:hypothetical protein